MQLVCNYYFCTRVLFISQLVYYHKIDAFSLSPVSKFTEDSIPVEFMSSSPAGKGTVYLIKYLTFTTVYFHLKNVKG